MKLLALTLAALTGFAAEIGPAYVPSGSTAVTTSTAYIYRLHLANTSGGAVTVILADRSTNCGGSVCQLWPTISIAPNTVYTADLGGIPANSGFTWIASTGSAVVGWVSYGYTR